jgi:hypothetical protein
LYQGWQLHSTLHTQKTRSGRDLIAFYNRFRGTYLVDRESGAALQTVEQEAATNVDVHNQVGDGPVRFRHDPRLVLSTRVYLTQEQVPCSTAYN